MQIERSPQTEQHLMDAMRQDFSKLRDGVHVSDLLAPRYAFWNRVSPKPVTDTQIGYFLAGRAHEDIFGRLSQLQKGTSKQWEGIWYTPDFAFGAPAEFKTRRRNLAREGNEEHGYSTYIEQLRCYVAFKQQGNDGWLIVFSLVETQGDGSTLPELAAYHVVFTDDELEQARVEMLERKLHLEHVLSTHEQGFQQQYRMLPLCWEWKCGKQSRKMQTAPQCLTCKRDFMTDWGIGRHTESKGGKGHEVRLATYRYQYEERCPHYRECKPYLDDPKRGAGG